MENKHQIIKNHSLIEMLHVSFKTSSTIRQWGKSNGICIPKKCMDMLHFGTNEEVEISVVDDMLCIRKCPQKKSTLVERLEDFYQCPLEDIIPEKTEEVDWGNPGGEEFW